MKRPLMPKNDRGSSSDFHALNDVGSQSFMLHQQLEEIQQDDYQDEASSMLEEGRCGVLVSAGELGIDDYELYGSDKHADDRDEDEQLFRAALDV